MAEGKNISLKVNFVMNTILTMSSFVFPLITFPYVSRILLAEGNGKVQLATSFVSYFVMISQLGLPTYGVRACAVVRDDRRALSKTVQELCMINLVMTVVSYTAFYIMMVDIPRLNQEWELYWIASAAIFLNTIGMEWIFKGLEQYSYITIRSLIFKVISVVMMFLMVRDKEDYAIYAGISVFASCGSSVMNLTQLHRFVSFKPTGGYDIKRHLKPVLIFFAMTCATTVYTNLDSVMLGFMATDADVGYYSVSVKIKNILVSVVTALGTVLLPRVSYYYEHGQMDEFWRIISKALRFVLLLSCPLAVFFMFFAKQSIFFLAGDTYANSILPMIVIMPTVILIGFTNIMGMQVLVPTGRERVVLYSTIGGAVVDLILNTLLIPSMQSLGATIGTLAAEAVVCLIQYRALRKEMTIMQNLGIRRVVLCVLVGALLSFWVRTMPFNDFLALLISAVIFFGSYLLVLIILKEPLVTDILSQIRNRIRKS
ncbi:flippase [Oscillospiraceae bacterium HCP3S3_D12]|jgi:O-antigen/teichoic acid export membrane protein